MRKIVVAYGFATALLLYSNAVVSNDTQSDNTEIQESFDTLFSHGNKLFQEQEYTQAAQCYKKALALHPTCSHSYFNLGQTYYFTKKYQKALNCYKEVIKLDTQHPHVYTQIGKLFYDVQQYKDAISPLKMALENDLTNNEIRLLLIKIYNNQQQYDIALELLEEGLRITPQDINLQFEQANIYNNINLLKEALTIYQALDARIPNNPSIIYNIAFTLKKLGLVTESLEYYDKVLTLIPEHADAWFSRGLAYLVLGDFEKGWEGYEWRYHKPEQGSLRTYNAPRWCGENLTGKTILLHAEQGFGDTFQFIRYAQLIKETYDTTVIAAVQKPLVTLLSLCPYLDLVVATSDTYLPPFDVQASLMSLPHIMKTRIDTVPCRIPYLFADEQLIHEWKKALSPDTNFKIGICWQGNNSYATPSLRTAVALKSITPDQFAPICAIPGITLYSLQKITGTDQLNNLPENMQVVTFDEHFDNTNGRFMDTAAVIANMDLVLTVDTSICHIASALGTPTWVLLPNPADWRWMINRNDSPWYPDVIRLFKQPTPGDWESMIAHVAQELEKYINKNKNIS